MSEQRPGCQHRRQSRGSLLHRGHDSPETTIAKHPSKKLKTTKKKAKASFEFASTEPDSSFECSLDRNAFASCHSPMTVKTKATAKAKKHTFEVRATDLLGNEDLAAAKWTWTVKRK